LRGGYLLRIIYYLSLGSRQVDENNEERYKKEKEYNLWYSFKKIKITH
jgi:hypothetical protein